MLWTSVDSLVRGLLLKEGKTLHHYIQYLSFACAGLQRLNTTTLKNIKSEKLPVNSYKAVTLPCDYVDFIRIGFQVGENVRPLIQDDKLNRLNNYDDSGAKVVFENVLPNGTDIDALSGDCEIYDYNNFIHDVSRTDYKYVVIPERNEIQLSPNFPYDYIVVDYISDGLDSDNATRVDPLATPALEKYILWQAKVHNRNSNDSERREAERRFNDEWRLLRAAKNGLTKADIIHAVRSGYSPTYKN